MKISPYAKAWMAFVVSGLAILATGAADDVLTVGEVVAAVAGGAASAGAVFGIPNGGAR